MTVASMPEAHLYVKSQKVVTSFYRAEATQRSSPEAAGMATSGVAVTGSMYGASDLALSRDTSGSDVGYMLPDDQARAAALVDEVAARRGYVVKVTDVGKAGRLTQFVEAHLKGVEQYPALVVPSSSRRLAGLEAFTVEKLCCAMPAELQLVRAFSYLKIKTDQLGEVQKTLLNYEEVKEIHVLTGDWDILAVLEFPEATASSKRQVLDFIVDKVAKINGVENTSTLVPEYSTSKFPI